MDQFALNQKSNDHKQGCADLVTMAERELAAFFRAVTKLFGSSEAEISAEDWMRELQTVDVLPASAREWRLLTVKAVTRLARRVKAAGQAASQLRSAVSL